MSGQEQHDKHKPHLVLIDRLRQQEADIYRLTSKLDEPDLKRRTEEGKWSLKELLCHMWRVQRVFAERIDAMLTRENPEIASYTPEGDGEFDKLVSTPTDAALSVFSRERASLLERLASLAPSEWHRPGRHPEYAHYDVHFQVEYMMHHEAHHIYQMYQRRARLGRIPH
jgi:uncharacterized damage-inducible protein DinB